METGGPRWSRKEAAWVCLGEVTVKQSKNGILGLRVEEGLPAGWQAGRGGPKQRRRHGLAPVCPKEARPGCFHPRLEA